MDKLQLIHDCEKELVKQFKEIENNCFLNSQKVLTAFHNCKVSETHFNGTTGYGYGDLGREVIEKVYSDIFKAEDALVRSQFISGSHALTVALFAILRPNDLLVSITGTPYDTLHEVIGIKENPSSLQSFGVNYKEIPLKNNDFDYEEIKKLMLQEKIKMIEIQRSKGYSTRKSLSINSVEKVINFIKKIDKDIIIMVDNCYCEFVDKIEPAEVGADLVVGSLIKNLGGGIAPNGAYIVGKSKYITLASERLTLPGEGKEVGPTFDMNKLILQGLYMAPSVVANSLKTAVLTSKVLEELGYKVEPTSTDERVDIVQSIMFKDEDKLTKYVVGIQHGSAIDSHVTPAAWAMPGYDDKVIMASGSFTQGSSIEISCDGPIRYPYIAYQQGSLTYEYGKIALLNAISKI